MTRRILNRPSDRGYTWRMVDPYCRIDAAKRTPHARLADVLRMAAVRARLAGKRRGHDRPRPRFHPLTADVLDARRIGIDPRTLRGAR